MRCKNFHNCMKKVKVPFYVHFFLVFSMLVLETFKFMLSLKFLISRHSTQLEVQNSSLGFEQLLGHSYHCVVSNQISKGILFHINLRWVVTIASTHNNHAFQLDISREWNIKKEFLVSVWRYHLQKKNILFICEY